MRRPGLPPIIVAEVDMQPVYRVSFFKKLADSTGHEIDACQGVVEVHANSTEHALETARIEFARTKQVSTWRMRADSERVECLPARKRVSKGLLPETPGPH
jgi:hypothetical protein